MKNYFELNQTYVLRPGYGVEDGFISEQPDNGKLAPYLKKFQIVEFEPRSDGTQPPEEICPSVFKIKTSDGRIICRADIWPEDCEGASWLASDEFKYFVKVKESSAEKDVEKFDVMVSEGGDGYFIRAIDKTEDECKKWALDWFDKHPDSNIQVIKRIKKLGLKVTKEIIEK